MASIKADSASKHKLLLIKCFIEIYEQKHIFKG